MRPKKSPSVCRLIIFALITICLSGCNEGALNFKNNSASNKTDDSASETKSPLFVLEHIAETGGTQTLATINTREEAVVFLYILPNILEQYRGTTKQLNGSQYGPMDSSEWVKDIKTNIDKAFPAPDGTSNDEPTNAEEWLQNALSNTPTPTAQAIVNAVGIDNKSQLAMLAADVYQHNNHNP